MKVAVIGSRGLHVDDLGQYLPKETAEIVSGVAKGMRIKIKELFRTSNHSEKRKVKRRTYGGLGYSVT